MDMSERAVLRDCLETLKHASTCYLQASLECDSDGLRRHFDRVALDKSEAKNAVFNLMHQAGIYKTQPADEARVAALQQHCRQILSQAGSQQTPVERERGDQVRPTL